MEKLYRIMIDEDGDDFVFDSGLTYNEAIAKKNSIKNPHGYLYIEEDTNIAN